MNAKQIEAQLSYLGYYNEGIEIYEAIKKFQLSQGVAPTGEWNEVTCTASVETIKFLQEFLNETVGSRLPINGLAGYATSVATSRYQQMRRLEINGTADRTTLRRIASDIRSDMDDEYI